MRMLFLSVLLLAACGPVPKNGPLEEFDPGQCLYCAPPDCNPCEAWHACGIEEALKLNPECVGPARCGLPPLLSYADAGCWHN
jgi:hypothetical protein